MMTIDCRDPKHQDEDYDIRLNGQPVDAVIMASEEWGEILAYEMDYRTLCQIEQEGTMTSDWWKALIEDINDPEGTGYRTLRLSGKVEITPLGPKLC